MVRLSTLYQCAVLQGFGTYLVTSKPWQKLSVTPAYYWCQTTPCHIERSRTVNVTLVLEGCHGFCCLNEAPAHSFSKLAVGMRHAFTSSLLLVLLILPAICLLTVLTSNQVSAPAQQVPVNHSAHASAVQFYAHSSNGTHSTARQHQDQDRCQLTRNKWCGLYHVQTPVPTTPAAAHNKTCPGQCSGVGVCNAMTGLVRRLSTPKQSTAQQSQQLYLLVVSAAQRAQHAQQSVDTRHLCQLGQLTQLAALTCTQRDALLQDCTNLHVHSTTSCVNMCYVLSAVCTWRSVCMPCGLCDQCDCPAGVQGLSQHGTAWPQHMTRQQDTPHSTAQRSQARQATAQHGAA
jgi:hypothetical protein